MKKIPYGMSNFEELIEENYLYVDKTKFIEFLENENAKYQFFIRPRRFGKSLFISMLDNYYDINKREKFDKLFGNLYIGKNPTPGKNSFLILRFSFAGIVTSESKERLIESFDSVVISEVRSFIRRYNHLLNIEKISEEKEGSVSAIQFLVKAVKDAGQKIFFLIDEYDNFANDIIGRGNSNLYYELLQSEGYVRAFYKALKDGTALSISRLFMTGVSPIMLDDLTSGFNVTENLTNNKALNEIMGFTEEELLNIIKILEADKIYKTDKLINDMREYYNGYMFNQKCETRVYNTDMVLYFLNRLTSNKEYPENILDNNVKTDYRKIREMAFNFKDEEMIEILLKEGEIKSNFVERFTLENMYKKRENFISLLFYLGMLTIKESDANEVVFKIPNYVIKTIYWEYFLDKIEMDVTINNEELKLAMKEMRLKGRIEPFAEYVSKILEKLSNRDLQKFDEKYVKAVILTLVNLDGLYMIDSEDEVENGYVDIILTKDVRWEKWITYEWVIELKYLKEKERHKLEDVKIDALDQLDKYVKEKIKGRIKNEGLKKAVMIVIGKKEIIIVEG